MAERDDSFTLPTITFGSVELGHGPDLDLGADLDLDASSSLNADPGSVAVLAQPLASEDALPDGGTSREATPVVAGDQITAACQPRPAAEPEASRPGKSAPQPAAQDRSAAGSATRAARTGEGGKEGRPPQPRPQVPAVLSGDSAAAPPMPQQLSLLSQEWPDGGRRQVGLRRPDRTPQARWLPQQPGPYRQRGFQQRRRPPGVPSHVNPRTAPIVKFFRKLIPLLLFVWIVGLLIAFFQVVGSP